jgi:hypothetical protein
MDKKASRAHLALLVVWLALVVPTVVLWRDSVFWVSLMSIYAILATHWSGWNAARAKEEAQARDA